MPNDRVYRQQHGQGRRSLWDRGTCPPIFMKGETSMVMSPNILEVMLFRMSARVTATVVCCILMQILCVVSQKSFSFWGTSSHRPPTGAPPRTSLGDFRPPDPQSSFMSPNNPVRSTPLNTAFLALSYIIFISPRPAAITRKYNTAQYIIKN